MSDAQIIFHPATSLRAIAAWCQYHNRSVRVDGYVRNGMIEPLVVVEAADAPPVVAPGILAIPGG